LTVSKGRAQALANQLDGIYQAHFVKTTPEGKREFHFPDQADPPIPAWRWTSLRSALAEFETVLSAEMSETTAYFVPRIGIFATPALAEAADESFPEDLRPHIPEKAKEDWRAAGRCLAFHLLSASGFHIARAVEATMEAYYQLFSGKPGKTLRSWDDYHKALDKIAKENLTPAPETKTLIEFDQMRTDYRNPIVHPRVSLDEADAKILFNNGESLITAMAKELKRAKEVAGGVQPALSLISDAAAS
jgi:hypothetical protein